MSISLVVVDFPAVAAYGRVLASRPQIFAQGLASDMSGRPLRWGLRWS